jgi:hypothetical protein
MHSIKISHCNEIALEVGGPIGEEHTKRILTSPYSRNAPTKRGSVVLIILSKADRLYVAKYSRSK